MKLTVIATLSRTAMAAGNNAANTHPTDEVPMVAQQTIGCAVAANST